MLKEMLFSNALVGESGSNIDVEELNVTENGRYYVGDNVAYSPVTVNVPQTTVTALTATENKVYTAPTGTAYSPVTVNVATSASYTLLKSKEFTVEASASTAVYFLGVILSVPLEDGKMIYVRIRDKSTVANDCFYGSDSWFYKSSGHNAPVGNAFIVYKRNSSGVVTSVSSSDKSGVYANNISAGSGGTGEVNIYKRQDATSSGTVGGTYLAEVYSLSFPDGVYPS